MSKNITSYAENFEDVLLWRALRHLPQGFYVDVGAGDPHRHSVTQALYDAGWHGINLEPAQGLLRRLRIERPADINLAVAAGARPGEAPFYETPGQPDSTFDAARAEALGAAGRDVLLRRAGIDTLEAVCAAHAPAVIHLLKIDTGAPAAAVLEGFDLAGRRPWVVVADAGAGIDAQLQAAGYALAYADGRNVFYTAPGHDDLRQALALPPHPADGFVLCEGHHYAFPLDEWRTRTAAAEADAAEAREWAKAHVREWREKYAQLEHFEQEAVRLQGELGGMAQRAAKAEGQIPPLSARAAQAGVAEAQLGESRKDLAQVRAELAQVRADLAQLQTALEGSQRDAAAVQHQLWSVYDSTSWRITRPLRDGVTFTRRARHWLRSQPHRARRVAVRIVRGVLRRGVLFVLSRPKLAFFVRRQINRFPGLVNLARRVLLRSQPGAAGPAPVPDVPPAAAAHDLPDTALRVLRDLQRRS
ncbi:FkbM family methyltransferase [Pseudoduganella lurida]|uniref:FkbM family methyltransferase n=2 Tax=Pseudoduganella lurida TaxID=1036180 RepID=A0A562R5I8_9BURK|nr:FkbM family methyltransferase [Pseudoduganella lurida]